MGRVADTRYRQYPWDENQATGHYEAPFGETEYELTRRATNDVTAPHEELEERTGPAPLFPPRLGYDRTAPGIESILSTARLYPDQSRSLSGTEAGYMGAPRNVLGNLYG